MQSSRKLYFSMLTLYILVTAMVQYLYELVFNKVHDRNSCSNVMAQCCVESYQPTNISGSNRNSTGTLKCNIIPVFKGQSNETRPSFTTRGGACLIVSKEMPTCMWS